MICKRCKEDKPKSMFYTRRKICKDCSKIYDKEYRAKLKYKDRQLKRCIECGKKPKRWYVIDGDKRTNWCLECGQKHKVKKTTFEDIEKAAARYVAIRDAVRRRR